MTKHVNGADPALVIFDKLEGHIADMAAKFVEIGEKYGPDVINLGLDVVRLTGGAHIILGLTCLMFMGLCVWTFITSWRRMMKNDEEIMIPVTMVTGIGAIILAGFTISNLFNFWNYVAVFYPVAYLAKKVMGL